MRLTASLAVFSLSILAACGGPADGTRPQVNHDPGQAFAFEEDMDEVAAIPPAPAPDFEPTRLKGMSTDRVVKALGRPTFTRSDAPAEIWQYRAKACTLDLFVYDGTINHYAVRSQTYINDRDCLNAFLVKPAG